MKSAIAIAQIFGPFMSIMGLWMLLYSDNLAKIMGAIKKSPASFHLGVIYNLLIGLFILTRYHLWSVEPYVFVTLLGWAMLIRGVLGLFAPKLIVKLFMTQVKSLKIIGFVPFIWGLILTWVGFYM